MPGRIAVEQTTSAIAPSSYSLQSNEKPDSPQNDGSVTTSSLHSESERRN